MTTINEDEVKRLAKLAMLSLSEEEVRSMSGELDNIFKMIEEINNFETEGVEQTAQVTGLRHVTREDKEKNYATTSEDLVSGATKSRDNFIEVPTVQ